MKAKQKAFPSLFTSVVVCPCFVPYFWCMLDFGRNRGKTWNGPGDCTFTLVFVRLLDLSISQHNLYPPPPEYQSRDRVMELL